MSWQKKKKNAGSLLAAKVADFRGQLLSEVIHLLVLSLRASWWYACTCFGSGILIASLGPRLCLW